MVLADLHGAAASADLALLRRHWWLNKHRINSCNEDKETPLHLACINGHADVVQFLIEKKCKLNPHDKFNKSPLMKAVEHQHTDCAAILLEHGADHDHRGAGGNTALHLAVMVSSKSLVELLLEHGADINAKNELGYTPLTTAITENHDDMVELLLQKGADVNAQDNVSRTPLTVAAASENNTAVQLLLDHGAVFPESDTESYTAQDLIKMVQKFVKERIDSSFYETTPVTPLETPALAESSDVPKDGAVKKEDSGPAEDQNKGSVYSIKVQPYRGDYKSEKKEDRRSCSNPEMDSKGKGKVSAGMNFNKLDANFNRLDVCLAAVERSKDVLPGQVEHEDDSSRGSEVDSNDQGEVSPVVQLPAANFNRLDVRSAAVEHGKGVLQPTSREARKEDTDSSWDSETDSESEGKMSAGVGLPAANFNRLDVCSGAVECSKGVLSETSGEAENEDDGSSWSSEPISDLIEKVITGVQRPAAKRNRVGVCCVAVRLRKGDYKAAGAEKREDRHPLCSPKTDSENQTEVSADVQLPAANFNRLDVRSAAVEHGKGVLQPTGREARKEDTDCSWDSEIDSESEGKMSAGVGLPAANFNRLDARSAAMERCKGVLHPAGGSEEDDDSSWDSETDSKHRREVSAGLQHPTEDRNRVGVRSARVERSKASRAEQKGHFISSSEEKLPMLHLDLQLEVDAGTQTGSEEDKQPLARWKLDKILKNNSLEEDSLGTVKTSSREEWIPLLEQLERCKTMLKDLKEHLSKNHDYAELLKHALMEKEIRITILTDLQDHLVDSSAAALPQLEERIRWLEIRKVNLEATAWEQAKTIEVLEKMQQIRASVSY